MITDPLAQVLILLAATVIVITLARRVGLPAILGYVLVGTLVGPHATGLISGSDTTRLLAELGVVFLLFTLGLEFSWPRMVAMRREVFGLGSLQMLLTAGAVILIMVAFGVPWLPAIALGGAVAVSSTAIILQQLTEQAEINRTHGRLAFSVLLFQDLAFVPFLVLASALAAGTVEFSSTRVAAAVSVGVLAVALVLVLGRFVLRPLLHEIAHSRLRELFTLAVLLVALGSAWISHAAGVSMASGAFLAGVMLAESEYRHQVEAVIRPFRDILLGVFFISVGMLLELQVLSSQFPAVTLALVALLSIKATIMAMIARVSGLPAEKAVRTGIVLSSGGEFGVAILTILLQGQVVDPAISQPLLVAIVLSMVIAPLLLRHNRRVARLLLREQAPSVTRQHVTGDSLTTELAQREHVILCGFGRVGQHLGRILESQGFEYLAVDLDPARVRSARTAGLPVVFGDCSDDDLLRMVGIQQASAILVSFSDPAVALGIVRAVRRLSADVPLLVRAPDDSQLDALMTAGATEVVPETFETSLMLASHVLMVLRQPVGRVVRTIGAARKERYASLRGVLRGQSSMPGVLASETREDLASVVLPPGAWCVGRTLGQVCSRAANVKIDSLSRQSVVGREPAPELVLREGDVLTLRGTPEALEHAEKVLLAG